MTQDNIYDLKQTGYTVLKNVVSAGWQNLLSAVIDKVLPVYQKPQGILFHAPLYNTIFIEFLQYLIEQSLIADLEKNFFHSKCILNSMTVIDPVDNHKSFAHTIHKDLRCWTGDFNMMLNCLVMLDDFTEDNGATWVLPGSHWTEKPPTEGFFGHNKKQVLGNKGDILIFNSNLYHCGADNISGQHRRSMPITLSKPMMKQLLDYPRAIGYDKQQMFSRELQQLLGYNSRVPASIEEWSQPEETRYYKKDQDITI